MDEWIECDQRDCPARALVIAHYPTPEHPDACLAWCNHHATAIWDRITASTDWIDDHRQPVGAP